MKTTNNNDEDFKKVMVAVHDYIFEKHKVCGVDEISSISGISKTRCRQVIPLLVKQKQLYEIFSGNGKPTLYIPFQMMLGVLSLQPKPSWIETYEFKEKAEQSKRIEEINKEIRDYEQHEGLLYLTGTPLERAVEFALKFLEFKDVKHLDEELHDVEFKHNSVLFVLETKGKTKQADKVDVQQLRGWIDKKIDEGSKRDELQGFLIVNHYRNEIPSKRPDPMTKTAIEFMKMSSFKLLTTYYIFKLVKDVIDKKITKSQARDKVIEGENY